jgi:Cornifin (SPRR) family
MSPALPARSSPHLPAVPTAHHSVLPTPRHPTLPMLSPSTLPTPSLSTLPTPSLSTLPTPNLSTLPTPSLSKLPTPSLSTLPTPSQSTLPIPSPSTLPTPSLSTLPTPSLSTLPTPSRPTLPTLPTPSRLTSPTLPPQHSTHLELSATDPRHKGKARVQVVMTVAELPAPDGDHEVDSNDNYNTDEDMKDPTGEESRRKIEGTGTYHIPPCDFCERRGRLRYSDEDPRKLELCEKAANGTSCVRCMERKSKCTLATPRVSKARQQKTPAPRASKRKGKHVARRKGNDEDDTGNDENVENEGDPAPRVRRTSLEYQAAYAKAASEAELHNRFGESHESGHGGELQLDPSVSKY